ncbi:hypothetical protein PoB_000059600 [Plakobranchus ocellatus]|uniref:Uncharacterized protein n=1 Tax=Plakobranchus ocellatus TaxID=259542 RepID=A0AAV3WUE8_9GAST|nr:hypothetical protein PoB_000059600 [Plakobranchus ocellatus]
MGNLVFNSFVFLPSHVIRNFTDAQNSVTFHKKAFTAEYHPQSPLSSSVHDQEIPGSNSAQLKTYHNTYGQDLVAGHNSAPNPKDDPNEKAVVDRTSQGRQITKATQEEAHLATLEYQNDLRFNHNENQHKDPSKVTSIDENHSPPLTSHPRKFNDSFLDSQAPYMRGFYESPDLTDAFSDNNNILRGVYQADTDKRHLDLIANSLIKREDNGKGTQVDNLDQLYSGREEFANNKRYLDGVASSLIKKEEQNNSKRYLDRVASSLIKKHTRNGEKRYLDGIARSLIKKHVLSRKKRYLDGVASSLIKKETLLNAKRYLDGVASSLIKKEERNSNKRFLDSIAGSLIKKDNSRNDKRYLDGVASSLIKKDISRNDKRYLDSVASSLIKKDISRNDKRYLDGVASSLLKKDISRNDKRYLDGVASSLIKKDILRNDKRYLDGVASSLIKKDISRNDKRYLDGVASSLIKKDISRNDKRYLDGVASSLIKKDISRNDKRYLDGVASSLIKKDISRNDKRYLDGVASSLIKKDISRNDKRYLDGVATFLIKKDILNNHKRYLDGVASSLIKRKLSKNEKRYLDSVANLLIKKYLHFPDSLTQGASNKRYLDSVAMSLIKRPRSRLMKRYLDGIASALIKKEGSNGTDKRYLDAVASSLIKRSSHSVAEKRTSEVVDDELNLPGQASTESKEKDEATKIPAKASNIRKRRDISIVPLTVLKDKVGGFQEPTSTRVRRYTSGPHSQPSHDSGVDKLLKYDMEQKMPPSSWVDKSIVDVIREKDKGDYLDSEAARFFDPLSSFERVDILPFLVQPLHLDEQSHFGSFSGREIPDFAEISNPTGQISAPSKRFRISTGARQSPHHMTPLQRQMSFQRVRQYLDDRSGGLAYKRHDFDVASQPSRGYQTRLNGYPRMSLQTRLRTLTSRAGGDQTHLRRFPQRGMLISFWNDLGL